MKLGLIFALLLSFLNWAAASVWTGEWSGLGKAETLNSKWDCEFVEMRLYQEEERLILRGGGYKCGELSAEYPYSVFSIEGESLVYEGQDVGKITDAQIHLSYEGGQFNLWLTRKDDGSLFYRELWADRNDFLMIEGTLQGY